MISLESCPRGETLHVMPKEIRIQDHGNHRMRMDGKRSNALAHRDTSDCSKWQRGAQMSPHHVIIDNGGEAISPIPPRSPVCSPKPKGLLNVDDPSGANPGEQEDTRPLDLTNRSRWSAQVSRGKGVKEDVARRCHGSVKTLLALKVPPTAKGIGQIFQKTSRSAQHRKGEKITCEAVSPADYRLAESG